MATQSTAPSKAIQKRIAKRGAITNADIQEYIDEVGIANLGNMSMNDVEQFLKTFVELGQRQKKKLPTKKKIEPTDSLVVADQSGALAKVAVEDQKKAEQSEPSTPEADIAKPSRFKSYAKSAGLGVLGLGSLAFNKMFPTLGALMSAFDKRIRKQDNDLATVNTNNQENARQVSRSSVFLSRVAENQLRTNELLEQIITAASGATLVPQSNTNINIGGGPEIDLRRRPASGAGGSAPDRTRPGQQSRGSPAQRTTPAPAAAGGNPRARLAAAFGLTAAGVLAGSAAAYAATRPTGATPQAESQQGAAAATPQATEPAIPTLPTPPQMTAEAVRRAGAPITEQEQAELFASRVLNIKARDIVFKADRFEFDQQAESAGVQAAPPPFVSSGAAAAAPAAAAAAGASGQIQNIVQRITQEFPNIVVTSTARPNDTNSQHATGNAADLSLRGLSQEQRATLIQNITTGRYGNVGGLGTYNASGDLLHVDTRSGARMAWGPNRSRTSLNQTPQWFQAAVTPWMSGATATAQREQEPGPGGEQMATATPSRPSTGAQVAEASVRSEVSMMQSQQVSSTLGEAPEQPASPTGSMEQSATIIDPNEPGSVEPADAAQRYARLFNIAA